MFVTFQNKTNQKSYSLLLSHHFKASKRKVSQSTAIEKLVLFLEIIDGNFVVECDGLRLLDVAQGGNIKHHPTHIIRVTPDLIKQLEHQSNIVQTQKVY